MTQELFQQIVAALLPQMSDAQERRALIEAALFGSPVLQLLTWQGPARAFTIHLVQRLDAFGQIAPGRPALVALLETVREEVGADHKAQFDRLMAQLQGAFAPISAPPPIQPIAPLSTPLTPAASPGVPPFIDTIANQTAAPAVETPLPEPAVPMQNITPVFTLNEKWKTPRWPRLKPFRPNILVMKGGGVKGIAYVGALEVLEQHGYKFDHFVGTSAGAITAALLAAGYNNEELREVLAATDFRKFKDGWLPLSILLLYFRKGLYRGEAFRVWLEDQLRAKFPRFNKAIPIRFKHLSDQHGFARRLTVFTSTKDRRAYLFDSTTAKDSELEISFACRCSMAIPYFFEPERIEGRRVVDGGMQNNYPVYALLDGFPELKDKGNFIGLYLGDRGARRNTKWLILDLFSIWGEAGDEEAKEYFIDRTIIIDPRPVKTTDFFLSTFDVNFLLAEGRYAALHWLRYNADEPDAEQSAILERELAAAEQKVIELRNLAINERWYKFVFRFVFYFLVIVLLVAGIYFATHHDQRPP